MTADEWPSAQGVAALPNGRARWRVWAPKAERVDLVLFDAAARRLVPMTCQERGYFAHEAERPASGQRYAYSLDGGPDLPDPCSPWQPEGIDRPSAVLFPEAIERAEGDWTGLPRAELVFYELHVGTFTPEGTFDAVIPRLPALRELGVTALELMPICQFAGARSWGYDGVFPFAVQNTYGGPEGLCRLIDACHRQGMALFLDAIYNHFGPEGNLFPQFGPYLTDAYQTSWGPALNYDRNSADPVRRMVIDNARFWIGAYHVDGLRLDAADQIFDMSPVQILTDIHRAVHAEGERLGRRVYTFAENDHNNASRYLDPPLLGGYGLDGQWNDDFHHAVHALLADERKGYYVDFGTPEHLAKTFRGVFVNDGSYSILRDRRHGAPAGDFPGDRFVAFIQNHDQVGNRLRSDRFGTLLSPPAQRLAAGLLLLAPRLPLLFMGEEYGETRPFPFFCSYQDPKLIDAVRRGRKAEFAYFGWDAEPPDPLAAETFDSAKLTWSWPAGSQHAGLRALYRDLLALRRRLAGLRDFQAKHVELLPGAILHLIRGGEDLDAPETVVVYFNLAGAPQPEPTRPSGKVLILSSADPRYGDARGEIQERANLGGYEFRVYAQS